MVPQQTYMMHVSSCGGSHQSEDKAVTDNTAVAEEEHGAWLYHPLCAADLTT